MYQLDRSGLRTKSDNDEVFHETLRARSLARGERYTMPAYGVLEDYWAMEMPTACMEVEASDMAELVRSLERKSIEVMLVGSRMRPDTRARLFRDGPTVAMTVYLALNIYAALRREVDPQSLSYPIDFVKVNSAEDRPRMVEMFQGRCVVVLDELTAIELAATLQAGREREFWRLIISVYDHAVRPNRRIESRLNWLKSRSRSRLANEYIYNRNHRDDSIPLAQILGILASKPRIPRDLGVRIAALASSESAPFPGEGASLS